MILEIREVDPSDEAELHRWWETSHEAMAGRPYDLRPTWAGRSLMAVTLPRTGVRSAAPVERETSAATGTVPRMRAVIMRDRALVVDEVPDPSIQSPTDAIVAPLPSAAFFSSS